MIDDAGMDMVFGGASAAANLERAIRDGLVRDLGDGCLATADETPPIGFLNVRSAWHMECIFLRRFMFFGVYAKAAVPAGCRDCYKVKISVPTMAAVVALRDLLTAQPHNAKCGIDLYNPHSSDVWAGYVYLTSLDEARAVHATLAALVREQPDLRDCARLTIKRGCSSFEVTMGPSDGWTFRDGQQALEAGLHRRFRRFSPPPQPFAVRKATSLVAWLKLAHAMGDDSYLRFTGGRPLFPPSLSYDPDGKSPTDGWQANP